MKFMSYTFAALAGFFFMGGLIILTNEGDNEYGEIGNISDIIR